LADRLPKETPTMSAAPRLARPVLDPPGDFDAAFDRAFVLITYAMNRFLVDHMLRVSRQLTGNDFESMVIWGVLAHQNVAHLLPPGSFPSDVLDEAGRLQAADGLRPLRLRDIVQITRIPKETARRKLERLAAQHWIERVDGGWVVSRERTEPELREFSRQSVRRFLTVADEMSRAMHEAREALAAEGAGKAGAAP
jgi:hypothetical protein